MKKLIVFVTLAVMAVAFGGCGSKVATVDPVKIMQTSVKMKNYQGEFQGKVTALQSQMAKEAQGLDQAGQQKKQQEFIGKANAEKQGFEQKIETELKATMQTVAKDKGYDEVLAKEVVYVGGTDITDDVLKKLDEGVQPAAVAAPAPATAPAVSTSGK